MKKIFLLLFIVLPFLSKAQRAYSEIYWLYYNKEGSSYIEREFKYGGGYTDNVVTSSTKAYREYLKTDSARAAYDNMRAEFAKTLVFYTEEEVIAKPVKLKPNDYYNKAVRAGKEPPIKHFPL